MAHKKAEAFVPNPEQMALWPKVSGNTLNGLGEKETRRPTPIYWHDPEIIEFGAVQNWFYQHSQTAMVDDAREERMQVMAMELPPVAEQQVEKSADEWTRLIKEKVLESGGDIVGIAKLRPEMTYEGYEVPPYKWLVLMGVTMDYEEMAAAPGPRGGAEIVRQNCRGIKAAKVVSSWIRDQGWEAEANGGPMAGPVLLIPSAIDCGMGELGKHGSLINRELGANFRLSCVMTNLPLVPDEPDEFGADDFCTKCQLCVNACPPQAISPEKITVRGTKKWYVNFDKCVPFLNETMGCGVCVAVCPWSRPGVAPNLVQKMARRRQTQAEQTE